jgi:hypothetical protein
MVGFFSRMRTASLSRLRSMVHSSAFDAGIKNICRIQSIRSGSVPPGFQSKSSPSNRSVSEVSNALKQVYVGPILHQLHSDSPFWIAHRKDPGWGFEEIYPSDKSWEQDWFKQWEEQARWFSMGPFQRAFELETRDVYNDMRKQIGRQVYIPVAKSDCTTDTHLTQ